MVAATLRRAFRFALIYIFEPGNKRAMVMVAHRKISLQAGVYAHPFLLTVLYGCARVLLPVAC